MLKVLFPLGLLCCLTLGAELTFAAEQESKLTTRVMDHKPIDVVTLLSERCLTCHARPGPWPNIAAMARLSSEEIYHTLWAGLMRELADGLSDAERKALARYISGLSADKPSLASGGHCSNVTESLGAKSGQSADWPGWSISSSNDRHVPDAALDPSRFGGLRLKWAFVFPEAALYTSASNQPTVVGDRLYVGNTNGMVYALDAKSGCTHWSFKARSHVRSTVAVSGDTVVFADYETNVYALDAATGSLRWVARADEQPSARMNGNVTVENGVLYVPISTNQEFTVSALLTTPCCSFNGAIAAFSIDNGALLWKTYLIDEPLMELGVNEQGVKRYGPAGVGVWSVPTVDTRRQLLYVTTGNQHTEPPVEESDALVALDLNTGEKKWVRSFVPERFEAGDIWHGGCAGLVLDTTDLCSPTNPQAKGDREIGAPAVLKTLPNGQDIVLVGTKDGVLFGLDPDRQGALLWEIRLGQVLPDEGPIFGGIQFGFAADDHRAYVPIADMRPVQGTAVGNMTSVDLQTGKLVWENPAPTDSCIDKPPVCNNGYMSPPTVAGSLVFAGSNDGYLRAFDSRDGKLLWAYDTARAYDGVNGLSGTGGAIARSGPTITGNMLFQTSGYGHFSIGMPGNVLLAFEFEEK